MTRPRMAFVSHVSPLDRTGGQNRRVRDTLRAACAYFDVAYIGPLGGRASEVLELGVRSVVDVPGVAPGWRDAPAALWHVARSGLKTSNFFIDQRLFSPARLEGVLDVRQFDVAFVHYVHAAGLRRRFSESGVPVVLDMHDVLAVSYEESLRRARVPRPIAGALARRYAVKERRYWNESDLILAVNTEEAEFVRATAPNTDVMLCPIAIDLVSWPYRWRANGANRVGFYGGLSQRGEHDLFRALAAVERLWESGRDLTFVVLGAGASPKLIARLNSLGARCEYHGFVDDPGEVLQGIDLLLCPFQGRYGFRTRLAEVAATGTPILCSEDAAAGMSLGDPRFVKMVADWDAEASVCIDALLEDGARRRHLSRAAREHVVEAYGFDQVYGTTMGGIEAWLAARGAERKHLGDME